MLQGNLRFVLFLIFLLSFFTVSGGVLFYAFGYRFNSERGIFVYGGSITLKSNPVQIDITIDGVPIPPDNLSQLNQSYHIAGIMPGEHAIEVSSPGYQTWSKHVIVRSGLSNEFWNITLPRQNYETVPYPNTEGFTRYFQSPEPTTFAAIQENEHGMSILMYDTDSKEYETLYSQAGIAFAFERNENLEWSTDGDRIVFPVLSEGQRHVLSVDVRTKTVRDLSVETGQFTMMRPRFNPAIRDSLLYHSDDQLYRLDLDTSADTSLEPLLLAEHIAAYDISGLNIYVANIADRLLYRFSADEEKPYFRPISDTPLDGLDTATTLIVYDEYRIAILSAQGALSFLNAYTDETVLQKLADTEIIGAQFSDDGKKLLFFSDHAMMVYFIRPWEVQPKRDQGSVWQIGRFADQISSIQWTKDYEHILYLKGSQVFMTELDNRDQRNINKILNFGNRPPLQILSRVDANQIFFVNDTGSSSELLSIDFPEFNNFFTR